MSVLSQKLQEAAKLFHTHQFKKSLESYEQCLKFAHTTQESESVIHNIMSTKASLQYILGQYENSLSTINFVLKKDPYHFLCLLRRSQVYKKVNKLKRSLKDLQKIFVFCPDNLQVSALKVQIEHLILKQNKQNETSSSEEEQEQQQQLQINFNRLRSIDRKSSQLSKVKSRKSRVTILGDTTYEYKAQQVQNGDKQEEDLNDKAIRTYKQIQIDNEQKENEEESWLSINIKAPKSRGKSILKNKGTSIFVHSEDNQTRKSKYLGRQSNILSLVKNIDGKLIPSAESLHNSNNNIKEVQFRKSISQSNNIFMLDDHIYESKLSVKSNSSSKRKSCLRNPSFQMKQVAVGKVRRSKFESMDSSKIDGYVVSNQKRKSIEGNYSDNVDQIKQNNDSDNENSSHNIFGSKQYVLSSTLRLKLGMSQDLSASQDFPKLQHKKSILKKNSSLLQDNLQSKGLNMISVFGQTQKGGKWRQNGAKKSVMFNCTL